MTRTPMARLLWPIWNRFWRPTKFFRYLKKKKKKKKKKSRIFFFFFFFFFFYHEIVYCVNSLESPHRGDSNEYTQHTITVLIKMTSLNYHHFLSDGVMINPQWSNISPINLHGPKMFELLRFQCSNKERQKWSHLLTQACRLNELSDTLYLKLLISILVRTAVRF